MANQGRNAKGNVVTGGRRIDFLGYAFNHENTRLRKSIKKNFARKANRIKRPDRRREVLAAYWGWCKWANCKNLWNKLTNNDMSFADLGIKGRITTKDGQKFFDVKKVRADNLINLPISILDFQREVKTRHGPGRYAIKILFKDEEVKFITNSFTLKNQLDQAEKFESENPGKKVFPIETVMKKRDIGEGRSDYYFE